MTFAEYVLACYKIQYNASAVIGNFGEPMNCYGFVYWFYKLCLGIELERNNVSSFDNIKCVSYNKVAVPENGDVLHLRTPNGNYQYHVGVYMNGIVYHFTYMGLVTKSYSRMADWVKGVYRVYAVTNQKRDI